jgi:hypothetical protein
VICRICKSEEQERIDAIGRVTFACPGCTRRRAKQCMDCRAPVSGKSWRCQPCKAKRVKHNAKVFDKRHREERRAAERKRYRKLTAAERAAHLARKKAWREANKVRVKLQKRKGRLSGTWGYRSRDEYLAYQNAYNAERAEAKRQYMRARYTPVTPLCADCQQPVGYRPPGRPKKRCAGCAEARTSCVAA